MNFVEPFFGSGAVLLGRPHPPRTETVNDLDCMIANFWRAIAADPGAVAHYADWPVSEVDLHARHLWLTQQETFRERMKTDPEYFDAKIAGWWVWGICQWIGSGWCVKPEWRGRGNGSRAARGIYAKRPQLRSSDGVHRKLPSLGDLGRGDAAAGVTRQLPHLSGARGDEEATPLEQWFEALAQRLRRVRVCCGNWTRILGPSPTTKIGLTGVFLDPPYASDRADVYNEESRDVAHDVREWAIAHGDDPLMRIALCGYAGEHEMPDSWECVAWKAPGGYGNQGTDTAGRENSHKENLVQSPLPAAADAVRRARRNGGIVSKRIHMCLDIRGFIRNNRFPKDYYEVFQHDDGKPMTPAEAQDFLFDALAKGWKVIPFDSACEGFDYQKGCPGHEVTE